MFCVGMSREGTKSSGRRDFDDNYKIEKNQKFILMESIPDSLKSILNLKSRKQFPASKFSSSAFKKISAILEILN